MCRFVAGLPDDVEISKEYNKYAQAAALVNAANGCLDHFPSKPSGMSDDLYDLGVEGAGSSNLAMGFTNIADSIINGYMEDSDWSNIGCVGHRRWILFPSLKYVGFGQVGYYSATYVMGSGRKDTFTGDYVAWPAHNMPMELYSAGWGSYAFSVTLGNDYDYPELSKVNVEVHSKKQNKTWRLNSKSNDDSTFFTVENSYYGDPKCIIFDVGTFTAGDVVSVKITGITKNGVSSPISYDVNFFEIEHTHSYKSAITKAATCSSSGVKTYTCEVCGKSYTETIPKLSHSYSEKWTVDVKPTCTEEGSKSHHCTVCGKKGSVTVIPKAEHTYTSKTTKEATCTGEGEVIKTCSVCSHTETEVIPAKGHSFGEYQIKENPTAEKDGAEERICMVCGHVENKVIPKLSSTVTTAESTAGITESSEPEEQSSQVSSESSVESDLANSESLVNDEQESQITSTASQDNTSSGEPDGSSEAAAQLKNDKNDSSTDDSNDDSIVIIIAVSVAAIVIVAAVLVFIIKKKKKQA